MGRAIGYTSDLSVDEVLLLDEAGFDPVELVMGSSYFHVGYQLAGWSTNAELQQLTASMTDARAMAMYKLTEEVAALGADGVVGVRLEVEHRKHHAEFTALGTAVVARRDNQRWRVGGRPFTSGLSGQDFWALVRGGYQPRALVMGCCVYHVARQSLGGWLSRIGNNCEMPTFTQALYDARELAMERLQREARAAGATDVVGLKVKESSHGWQAHVIEFLAIGTAVAPSGEDAVHDPIAPILSAAAGKSELDGG
jgi:uncharacterized protein YbjQ (UPF0145 family)